MPTFTPLTAPQALPSVGQAIERATMDWKVKPGSVAFERAKDVAAFANHLGGTLLIGAQESRGQLQAYVGLAASAAGQVRNDYSNAVADRCQPPPMLDFEEYIDPSDPTKKLVAINVQPSLNLVGVRINGDKSQGYGGDAYVFPIRSGIDTYYLQPGQLPMFMTPRVRRIAVLLSSSNKGDMAIIKEPSGYDFSSRYVLLDEVREHENVVTFSALLPGEPTPARIPLDRITTAFYAWDSNKSAYVWRIHLELWDHPPPPPPRH